MASAICVSGVTIVLGLTSNGGVIYWILLIQLHSHNFRQPIALTMNMEKRIYQKLNLFIVQGKENTLL